MTVLTTALSVLLMIAVLSVKSDFITPQTTSVFKIALKLPNVISSTVLSAPLMSLTTEHSVIPATLVYNRPQIIYHVLQRSAMSLTASFASQGRKWAASSVRKNTT